MNTSRRTLMNLLLAGMVAALVLVVWLEPGIEAPPPPPVLTQVDPATVARISIDYPERPSLTLERRGDHWQLTAPFDMPANDYKVATVLDLLGTASKGDISASGSDLARFGLDAPRAVVRFDQLEVAFGDTEPIDGYRYVRIGERIHLTGDRFFYQLNTGATGFVSYLLLGPDADPRVIDLGDVRFERTDQGWRSEPSGEAFAADAGGQLAAAWRTAQGVSVKEYQADTEAEREVSVDLADGKTSIDFRVYKEGDDTLFVRPDKNLGYVVPESLAKQLLEPAGRNEGREATSGDVEPGDAAADQAAPTAPE